MASIGETVVLADGREVVVVDTFEKYGSASFDAVTKDGQRVWVSGEYKQPYTGKPYVRGYGGGTIGEETEDGPMSAYFRF